jgi:hypothetical protein
MPRKKYDGKLGDYSIFEAYELQETSGAHTGFNRDSAETDTPQDVLSTKVDPATLREGTILKIRARINVTANAINTLWLFQKAVAGNYESRMNKLFDSSDHIAIWVDDEEYEWDVEIPFILGEIGKFYYMKDESGALGNVQGYIWLGGIY